VLVLRGIRRGGSWDAILWLRMRKCRACVVQGCRPTRQLVECQPQLARRVVLGGGVPLVGPQKELHGSSEYTPSGFASSPEREVKKGFSGFITTNKQTKK